MTMRLDFTLDRQVITRIDSNRVVAGSKGYVTAHFTDVSGDWVEPVTAIFGAYTVLLEGMECAVPWEVLADPGAFEVSAFCGDLHTANTVRVDVEATGYKKGETPGDPTPDVYAVLVEKARRAEEIAQSVRDDADAGHFDGEDGKTPVRGVDYWTPEDRKPIEDATLDATTAASKADAAAEKASVGEASRAASEIERVANETERIEAESGRKSAEATRVANESERTETFNANLTYWNGKVDAACKKATDTASKAAQDAKTATDAAIAQTQEATNAAVAKADKATASATTAANKAEAAVSKLPLPLGNTLKGEAESTMVSVHDAYPAPLITAKVMGQSNQQQEPAPSPENPQEITNLNKAELVITGRNICPDAQLLSGVAYSMGIPTNRHGVQAKFPYVQTSETDGIGAVLNTIKGVTYSIAYLGKANTAAVGIAEYKSVDDVGDVSKVVSYSRVGSSKKISLTASIDGVMVFVLASQWADGKTNLNTFAKEDMIISIGKPQDTYVPCAYEKTPIDLKGNELCSLPNGVKDEVVIDAEGNVSLIKRVTKIQSDKLAELVYNVYPADENGNLPYVIANFNDDNYFRTNKVRCNVRLTGNLKKDKSVYATWNALVVVDTRFTDVETAKQILKSENGIYYYEATPQIIPLGKVELPALPEATSNIWNNGNIPANVYINYLKDVNIAFADLESKLTQAVVATAANL